MVYSAKLVSGLGAGMGAVVVGAWGHSGAFILAGSISLLAGCMALFLTPPGRDKETRRIAPNPQPLGEDTA
jgi:predicted MFS family arabinose efflux permease